MFCLVWCSATGKTDLYVSHVHKILERVQQ